MNKISLKIIENYENSLQAIYDHVGFKEDWVICPIDNSTEMFWKLDLDKVIFHEIKEEIEDSDEGNCYVDAIYTQSIYEGKDFTMIFCDPHVDGMKWFRLFDNNKRI